MKSREPLGDNRSLSICLHHERGVSPQTQEDLQTFGYECRKRVKVWTTSKESAPHKQEDLLRTSCVRRKESEAVDDLQ